MTRPPTLPGSRIADNAPSTRRGWGAGTGDGQIAVPRRGPSRWTAGALGLVASVVMFGCVQQWRLESLLSQTTVAREVKILTELDQSVLHQNATLASQMQATRRQIAALAPPTSPNLGAELVRASMLAGLAPVRGAGVTVRLADASTARFPGESAQLELVHDQYVLHIVGLLVGAGADAVAIAGQRYVSTTSIFCAGPTISVNGTTYGSPFVIQAVGPPAAMMTALAADPDVQGWSQLVSIHYRTDPQLLIPGLAHYPVLTWVRPAPSGGPAPRASVR